MSTVDTISASSSSITQTLFDGEVLPRLQKAARMSELNWMIGAPGSGKGTQGSRIAALLGHRYHPIVTSQILDNYKKEQSTGNFVSDPIATGLLFETLAQLHPTGSEEHLGRFIIDGFPRTFEQTQPLYELIDHPEFSETEHNFYYFNMGEDEKAIKLSIERQMGRGNRDTDIDPDKAGRRSRLFFERTLPAYKQIQRTFVKHPRVKFIEVEAAPKIEDRERAINTVTLSLAQRLGRRDIGSLSLVGILEESVKSLRKPALVVNYSRAI
jgi:adenylate kinase family enzyme